MYYIQLKLTPHQKKIIKKIYRHGDKYACYLTIRKEQLNWNIEDNHKAPDLIKINPTDLKKINSYNNKLDKNKKGILIYIDKSRLLEQHPFNNGGLITTDMYNWLDDEKYINKETINKSIKEILFPIHPLSNFEIEAYCKLLKINVNVLPKDKIQRKHIGYNKALVINLDDAGNSGTHWVCLVKSKDKKETATLYYDSYGVEYPPQQVVDLGIKNLVANDSTHQHSAPNSILCGYYCLKIIKSIQIDGMDYEDSLEQFNELNDIYELNDENMDIADNLFI